MTGPARAIRAAAPMLIALALGCDPGEPQTGGQTNWLRECTINADCGRDLSCECGACTRACDADASCAGLPEASCILAGDSGAVALCGGRVPAATGLCLPRCTAGACPTGTTCTAGVCAPLREPTATVTVDTSVRHQTLVGFGAGIGYTDEDIVQNPAKAALYDAMFAQSGFEVVRLRNRYNDAAGGNLASQAEIVAAAAARLGRTPTLILSSASPPGALKATGSATCDGNEDTCTLSKLANGSFDYPGFAAHWRASLDAYAAQGIEPDYIGIQNDPNFVPPASAPMEACKFLPVEGTATVSVNGTDVQVQLPGFNEALAAVEAALPGLASVPRIAAPEATGVEVAVDYASQLDLTRIDAIAHHLYGLDTSAINRDALLALNALGQQSGLPIFQTEMQSQGIDTAILVHEALSTIGVSMYLQNDYVSSPGRTTPDPTAVIALSDSGFSIQDPYYTLRHYALDTDPGWVRVSAASDQATILATAWLSPADDALTVVIVNPDANDAVIRLSLGSLSPGSSAVTRTVFPGVERAAELGVLASDGTVTLPSESIVTVAIRR